MKNETRIKIALVTGGGAGIGRAISMRLAAAGYSVFVNDRDASLVQQVVSEITAAGHNARPAPGDMGRDAEVAQVFSMIDRLAGRLDVLVTQAGTVTTPDCYGIPAELEAEAWRAMLAEDETLAAGQFLRSEDFDAMLQENLHATYYCCQKAVPLLRAAGGGHIVTMSSAGGGISSHFFPPYGVAKGAVVGLTRALARSLRDDGIVVNCIAQGFIDAGPWKQVPELYPEIWKRDWEVVQENGVRVVRATPVNRLPLKRLGRPEEVAALVEYLVSGEANYLIGQNLNLSGGVLIP